MKKIMLCSGKGGVGKSVLAASIALALGKKKSMKIALADLDVEKPSIPLILKAEDVRVKVRKNMFLPIKLQGIEVISSGFIFPSEGGILWTKRPDADAACQLIHLTNFNADICIIEAPPLSLDFRKMLKLPLDGALVVATPIRIDLEGSKHILRLLKENEVPILGFIINRCTDIKSVRVDGGQIRWDVDKRTSLRIPILGKVPESSLIHHSMLVKGIEPLAKRIMEALRNPIRLKRELRFCPVMDGECVMGRCTFWEGDRCGVRGGI